VDLENLVMSIVWIEILQQKCVITVLYVGGTIEIYGCYLFCTISTELIFCIPTLSKIESNMI
jgi:hypothetical protein